MPLTSLVNVKHGKQLYKAIELHPGEGVPTFRLQLFSVTSVPPERQKLMFRGKVIQDESDLSAMGLKDVSQRIAHSLRVPI